MKFFSVIFSLYILVLSGLPCGDADECKVLDNDKTAISKAKHSDHQQDTENCSPFCTCVCCGTNIDFRLQSPTFITENHPNFYVEKVIFTESNHSFSSNFYGNIWQPPKV